MQKIVKMFETKIDKKKRDSHRESVFTLSKREDSTAYSILSSHRDNVFNVTWIKKSHSPPLVQKKKIWSSGISQQNRNRNNSTEKRTERKKNCKMAERGMDRIYDTYRSRYYWPWYWAAAVRYFFSLCINYTVGISYDI